MDINPQQIDGIWEEGWALDLHTLSSVRTEDASGNVHFDTKRPPIAEAMYRLKYCNDISNVVGIAKPVADFLLDKQEQWNINLIVPVPPSNTERPYQPVNELANAIGILSKIPVDNTVLRKNESTPSLKTIDDPEARREILKDAFSVEADALKEKNVLIFDDIYRSGETLNAICKVIKNQGNSDNIYALTVTKTRAKK
jgi:predicted amidophosphoribosyltransferase